MCCVIVHLSLFLLLPLSQTTEELLASPEVIAGVLISAKPGSFIAGADIGMLDAAQSPEEVLI